MKHLTIIPQLGRNISIVLDKCSRISFSKYYKQMGIKVKFAWKTIDAKCEYRPKEGKSFSIAVSSNASTPTILCPQT